MKRTGFSRADLEALRRSSYFDEEWYLSEYPDVRALGMDPAEHFLLLGRRLKRRPGPPAEISAPIQIAKRATAVLEPTNPKKSEALDRSVSRPKAAATSTTQTENSASPSNRSIGPLAIDRYLAMRQDVAESGFWDERWYLSRYYHQYREYKRKFAAEVYVSPLDHYLEEGWKVGFEPSERLPLQITQTKLRENKITYFLNKLRFDGYHFDRNIWIPKPTRIAGYLAQKQRRKASKVVYTCIVNGFDNLMQPYHIADDWDYVCFTDDSDLIAKNRIGVWDIRPLSSGHDNSRWTNRWHKMHPHVLFPDHQESLYVDGNMNVISPYIFDQIEDRVLDILLPKHFVRNCSFTEIDVLLRDKRFDEGTKQQFKQCRDFLEAERFPVNSGLTENNVIYRKHHERLIVNLMEQWWDAYQRFPPRDQPTLTYVFWKNGLDISQYTIANCRVNYRDFWIVKHNSAASVLKRKVAAKALRPAFESDNIGVVFSTNEQFVPYLGVAIFSLIQNSSSQYNYDIIVLGRGLSTEAQQKLGALVTESRSNVSIRFYDMGEIFEALPGNVFHVEGYVPVETYNKCFITEILSGYDRCVYLDSDIVVMDDVQKLHDTPLNGRAIAASVNVANINAAYGKKEIKGKRFDTYLKNDLGVLDHNKYFQAGVLVIDLKSAEAMNLVDKSIQAIKEVDRPIFFDQCIFNKIFYNNVAPISTAWNHVWYMQDYSYLRGSVSDEVFFDYAHGRIDPKIIHFASKDKPHTKFGWQLGSVFWKYAYGSPFKDEILQQLSEADNEVSSAMRGAIADDWYGVAPRVLIHLHLYYIDQLDTMLEILANVTGCQYDLYVTMVERNLEIERIIKTVSPDAAVLIVPNVGYDIYPFLYVLQQVRLARYQYILKIHTKNRRLPGEDRVYGIEVPGYGWRDELLNALAGSKETFSRNLNALLEDKSIGCLGAKRFVFSTGENREEANYRLPEWRSRCGVIGGHRYVGGSMFLARAYPFERLKGLRMQPDDFKTARMGTKDHKNVAHIVERLLGIVVESEGFEIRGV